MEKPEIPHRLRALIGQSVDAIDTPALVVDLGAANRNLQRMAEFAAKHRLRLRPHAKMHKSAEFARLQLQAGAIEDGTALGDAILAALNRLRVSTAGRVSNRTGLAPKSQAIILITDGRSNAGTVAPETAAAAARALGIRIHAIGIGSRGPVVIPMDDPMGGTIYRRVQADLDENTLREIATSTGGSYFRADDGTSLTRVFRDIDRLEKRPMEEKVFFTYRELFPELLFGVLALGLIELTLRSTLLRTLP